MDLQCIFHVSPARLRSNDAGAFVDFRESLSAIDPLLHVCVGFVVLVCECVACISRPRCLQITPSVSHATVLDSETVVFVPGMAALSAPRARVSSREQGGWKVEFVLILLLGSLLRTQGWLVQ